MMSWKYLEPAALWPLNRESEMIEPQYSKIIELSSWNRSVHKVAGIHRWATLQSFKDKLRDLEAYSQLVVITTFGKLWIYKV